MYNILSMKFFLISILFVFIVDISFSQSLSELVTKGDSCLTAKNPSIALQYYSRAIELDSKCICVIIKEVLYMRKKVIIQKQ